MAPSDYIREVRLKIAAEMLENDKLSVREVANSSGFGNMAYFYRCFAVKYGMSPKQYRENKKEK